MTKNPKDREGNSGVGYGRPPEHSRFKPGQSGNLKGRPKGVSNFKTDVQAILKMPVKVTRDGKPRKISTQKGALLLLREKGLKGVSKELFELLNLGRTYNDEELVAARSLSADDASILKIYNARVLSGAAVSGVADDRERSNEDTPASKSSLVGEDGDGREAANESRSKKNADEDKTE
jgi:hypothetical protein